MKNILYFLIGVLALSGVYLYLDRDIATYQLGENDVVVKNGEFHSVGRVSGENAVEKIEVYHNKGDKLKEYTLDQITEDVFLNSRFLSDLRFKEDDFSGAKLTTENIDGTDKLFYHFTHKETTYKHKILPISSQSSYFHWNKIHVIETD